MQLLALVSLSMLAASACTLDFDATDSKPGNLSQPILHGAPDTSADHNGILRVFAYKGDERSRCSGTVIAERTVLTAAHCLDNDPDSIEVGFGHDENNADWFDVTEFWVHPDYGVTPGTTVKQNDIAILRLEGMPSDILPIPPLPPSDAILNSDLDSTSMQLVGYGMTDTESSGTRRAVSKPISFLCSGSQKCTWYWKPFFYANVAPGNVCHRINPAGTCYGDSGGPALVERDGVEYVAGVNSWVNSGCENIACATKVDQFDSFITAHLLETDEPVEDEADAGSVEVDAGPLTGDPDAGPDSQDASAGSADVTQSSTDGGCSSAGGTGPTAPPIALLLALLLFAVRQKGQETGPLS